MEDSTPPVFLISFTEYFINLFLVILVCLLHSVFDKKTFYIQFANIVKSNKMKNLQT